MRFIELLYKLFIRFILDFKEFLNDKNINSKEEVAQTTMKITTSSASF